jgi:Na+/H+ antiporter NhaD/arsenite permease-like protein
MAIPRGVPIITARKYPDIAILSDEPICSGKVAPSGAVLVIFLIKVLKTTTGLGRVVLGNIFSIVVTRYQKPKKRIIDTMEIQIKFFFCPLVILIPGKKISCRCTS